MEEGLQGRVDVAGGVPLSASSGWGWPSWRAPWCLRLERRWVVNALRGSWLRPLAVPWMWTLEWRLLWMIFLWPLLLRQGRGASTALFQVALAQIRLGPLVGRVRALLRAHVDAHLSGSLLGQVPSDWLQARGRQRCGVCGLIRYPLWHPPNVPPCSPGGCTAGGTETSRAR